MWLQHRENKNLIMNIDKLSAISNKIDKITNKYDIVFYYSPKDTFSWGYNSIDNLIFDYTKILSLLSDKGMLTTI